MDYYLAKFEPDGDGLLVTFPDLPEAITGGADEAEALANATDALEVTLLTYAGDDRAIPDATRKAPSGGSYRRIPVSATIAAKLAFIAAFREAGITRTALAAKLGKAETEIRRMLDPYHATKLPALEAGLRALGKRLVITVEKAA
jgi:antitoxin HicB